MYASTCLCPRYPFLQVCQRRTRVCMDAAEHYQPDPVTLEDLRAVSGADALEGWHQTRCVAVWAGGARPGARRGSQPDQPGQGAREVTKMASPREPPGREEGAAEAAPPSGDRESARWLREYLLEERRSVILMMERRPHKRGGSRRKACADTIY